MQQFLPCRAYRACRQSSAFHRGLCGRGREAYTFAVGALGMLKADICQISHHGQNGCTREFYQAVSPETALWCTPEWLWNNDAGNDPGSGPWDTLTVRAWLADMGVKKNLVMKDGDQQLSLP